MVAFGAFGDATVRLRRVRLTLPLLVSALAGGQLWLMSTPIVSKWLAQSLEQQFPAQTITDLPSANVALILGGATRGIQLPRLEIELGSAGNRVLHAARLYRSGKVKKIFVSGGSISWGET